MSASSLKITPFRAISNTLLHTFVVYLSCIIYITNKSGHHSSIVGISTNYRWYIYQLEYEIYTNHTYKVHICINKPCMDQIYM